MFHIVKPRELRVDTWELFLIEHFKNNLTKDEIIELLPYYERLLKTLISPGTLDKNSHKVIVKNVNCVFDVIKFPNKIKTFDDWLNLEKYWMDLLVEKWGLQKYSRDNLIKNSSETLYYKEF